MEDGPDFSRTGMHIVSGCLVVPVDSELDESTARELQKRVLEKSKTASPRGVLIDVSAVRVLDSLTFKILADTARMISMLGPRSIFVGFQAGVASALVDLDVDLADLNAALDIEDGFELLHILKPSGKQSDEDAEEDPEAGPDDSAEPGEQDER